MVPSWKELDAFVKSLDMGYGLHNHGPNSRTYTARALRGSGVLGMPILRFTVHFSDGRATGMVVELVRMTTDVFALRWGPAQWDHPRLKKYIKKMCAYIDALEKARLAL